MKPDQRPNAADRPAVAVLPEPGFEAKSSSEAPLAEPGVPYTMAEPYGDEAEARLKMIAATTTAWVPPTLEVKVQVLSVELAKIVDDRIKDLYSSHYKKVYVIDGPVVTKEVIVYRDRPGIFARLWAFIRRK